MLPIKRMGTAWKYFASVIEKLNFLLLNFDIIESFFSSRYWRVLTARPMSTTRYWLSEGSVPICKKIFWRKLFVFLFQINWQGHTVLAACRLCSRQNWTKQNKKKQRGKCWHDVKHQGVLKYVWCSDKLQIMIFWHFYVLHIPCYDFFGILT